MNIQRTDRHDRGFGHEQFAPEGLVTPEIGCPVGRAQRVQAPLFFSRDCIVARTFKTSSTAPAIQQAYAGRATFTEADDAEERQAPLHAPPRLSGKLP